MVATIILSSSSASPCNDANFCWGTISASTRNSSHSIVSSSSCSTVPNFAINSAFDRARDASRKLAATLVPARKSCLPKTSLMVVFGKLAYSLITRSAKALVRSRRPSILILRPFVPLRAFCHQHPLSAFGFPLFLLLFPAMGIAHCDHRGQDVVPGLSFHHHGVGEHAAVPADVADGLGKLSLLVA